MSFSPCIRRAEESNYRVTGPWGGPRFERSACQAVEGGWLDTLVLSSDGRKLEGSNQLKNRVWAERLIMGRVHRRLRLT